MKKPEKLKGRRSSLSDDDVGNNHQAQLDPKLVEEAEQKKKMALERVSKAPQYIKDLYEKLYSAEKLQ